MNNNVYLSEEQFQKTNKKIKKTGVVLMLVGVVLVIIGIIIVLQEIEYGAIGIVLGFFACFVGLVLRFFIGNQRQINAYFSQQAMPIAKENIEKIAPTVGNAAKEISKGIKEGLKEEEK